MKEILQKWLFETVGIKVQMETLGIYLRDGILFAKLLNYYKIVNKKVIKHLLASDKPTVCENNLREIGVWFDFLDVKFDDEIISHIINGRTASCLKLLYELYLALNNKQRLNFTAAKRDQRSKEQTKKKMLCQFLHDRTSTNRQKVSKNVLNIASIPKQLRICRKTIYDAIQEKPTDKQEMLHDRMRLEDIQFVQELKTDPAIKSSKKPYQSVDFYKETEISKTSELELTHSFEHLALSTKDKSVAETEREHLRTQMAKNILQQSEYEKQVLMKKLQTDLQENVNQTKFLEIKNTLDNESLKYEYYFSTCKTSEEEITSQLEAIKKLELHKKLYNEKIKKRNKKHFTIALQIVEDLVRGASNVAEPKQSDKLIKASKNLSNDTSKTNDENIPIINMDNINIDQQTVTDEDFDEYNYLIGDWFNPSREDVSYDDMFILAHIVYRLQEAKLPPITPLKPANIPKYRVTAILKGSFNELQITILKTLLVKSKICVVDIESAILFCIERYKLEADIKPPEILTKKDKNLSKAKNGKSKASDTASSKVSKTSSKKTSSPRYKDEEVQTTPSLLNELPGTKTLSTVAELGMQFYNLETFNDIANEDIINLLVEFLKSQVDIEGWVLINFPSTLNEAYHLETILSGKRYPNVFNLSKDETNVLNSSVHSLDKDHNIKIKHSKLVYLQSKKEEEFCSYFTSLINVIKSDDSLSASARTETTIGGSGSQISTSREEASDEEVDLTTIYKKIGILKNICYETINFNTLKKIARAILQCDSDVNKIPSTEIFGDEVINQYSETTPATKGKQSAKATIKSSKKKTPQDELTVAKEFLNQLITSMEKADIIQNSITELVSQNDNEKSQELLETKEETFQLPCNEDWTYTDFPIVNENKIALAALWDEMETNYINSVKQILYVNKTINNLIPLYINYIDTTMNDVYNNNKNNNEKTVKEFLQYFNNVLENKPEDENISEQLSNDVFNMERWLWNISDERKNNSERKRRQIIKENWIPNEMIAITNNYLSLLNVEVNRCNQTLDILHKYYSRMCFIPPEDNTPHLISQIDVNKYSCEICNIRFLISKILINKKDMNLINPAYNILTKTAQHYFTEINRTKCNTDYIIDVYDNLIRYKKEQCKAHDEQDSGSNIYRFSYQKQESDENQIRENYENITAFLETDDDKIEIMLNEWQCVVKSELDRLKWRIDIIKEQAFNDLDKLEKQTIKVFYKHNNRITTSYLKENECINNLCTIFRSAMKYFSPIKADIITENNCIYINEEDKSSSFENTFENKIRPFCFSVKQLETITDRLKSIAPNGIIKKQTLRFLLEDMIFYEQSVENVQLFPEHWKNLSSKNIIQLFDAAFGTTSKVYWKQFILFCLDMHFPETHDIISCKEDFSLYDKNGSNTISYDDYQTIKFWFEEDLIFNDHEHKNRSIKEFLFSLFQTDEKTFNYIEFLLLFSKDESSVRGFGKALTSLSGKSVIVYNENAQLEDIITEYNNLLSNLMKEMINEIVMSVMYDLDGVKIVELEDKHSKHVQNDISFKSLLLKKLESEEKGEQSKIEYNQENKTNTNDKESQTLSLNEILYDQYITKNKLYQWTVKIPSELIISLLESYVFPVLEFYDIISTENIQQDLRQTVTRLEHNGLVHVPSLMEEISIHSMFSNTHLFQIFSFSNALTKNLNEACFL